MRIDLDDTIAALASAPGGALRGIIRISGEVIAPLESLVHCDSPGFLGNCRSPQRLRGRIDCPPLPRGLPLELQLWPTPRSYTGQPMAELHLVGSPPLLDAVLGGLLAQGVRPARPGEFTLRAFLAGRLDLVQAEGVLGVVDAREEQGLQQALNQLAGGTSTEITRLRGRLLDLLSELEAGLDFADEEIEFLTAAELTARIEDAQNTLSKIADRATRRTIAGGRPRVVLAGLPNAGKSTLFNALLGRDAALVSDVSGTTRDYLRGTLDWEGLSVELFDTAGWEAAAAEIDASAQAHRAEQAAQADLLLWCTPADLDDRTRQLDTAERQRAQAKARDYIHVITKSDRRAESRLPPLETDRKSPPYEGGVGGVSSNSESQKTTDSESPESSQGGWGRSEAHPPAAESLGAPFGRPQPPDRSTTRGAPNPPLPRLTLAVSALTGDGLPALKQAVAVSLCDEATPTDGLLGTTAARCADSLAGARTALEQAHEAARLGAGDELVAVELRETLDHLGRIVGAVYTDDILDRIFSKFCIGK